MINAYRNSIFRLKLFNVAMDNDARKIYPV